MMNWKWPNGKDKYGHSNGWLPWYVCGWRLFWSPFVVVSVCIATWFVFVMRGPKEAKRFWDDAGLF